VVGAWVLETACSQAAQWRRSGASPLRIGINLFAAQFLANDLSSHVAKAIERYQLPPDTLELEITENIILNRDEGILEQLQKLRSMSIRIAFDDFGTGYASLSLLKNYPLTRIKIDQGFIGTMCTSRRDEATVAAAVTLARNYDLEVIAEGVETEEQLAKLMQLQCDEAQGYLLGRPMAVHDFSGLLNIN
jgi:EAL domain-containing protein (putative c-di-GMP-specific phosphodiesterase class I)